MKSISWNLRFIYGFLFWGKWIYHFTFQNQDFNAVDQISINILGAGDVQPSNMLIVILQEDLFESFQGVEQFQTLALLSAFFFFFFPLLCNK